jgi:hypothetical protein
MTEIEIAERTVATLADKRERAALRVREIVGLLAGCCCG